MRPWVGCDLDGTLAVYNGWVDDYHIGEPIAPMVNIVKHWLSKKFEVKIFTARVSDKKGNSKLSVEEITKIIQDWTEKHIGVRLAVTCEKDYGMIRLYDDRCKQVEPNTGILIEDRYNDLLVATLPKKPNVKVHSWGLE